MDTIGSRIAHIRKKTELNQKEFAARLGISQGNLSDMENNKYSPSAATLLSVIRCFNVSIDWLLTGDGPVTIQVKKESELKEETDSLTEKEIELLSVFEQIPEEQKDLVINILKPFIKEGAAVKENIEIPDRIRRKRKPVLNKKGSSYSSTGTTDRYASRMNA